MVEVTPKDLLEAIGEMAMAIAPYSHDVRQRQRIAQALSVLVDHVIASAAVRSALAKENDRGE